MSFISTLFGKSKTGFNPTPYTGYQLPAPTYLKPSEKLTWDILSRRAQGEDVGFDPKRMQLLTELAKSELGRQEEDQLRSAQGTVSQAGLSGNPRVYEALGGRVKRDVGRSLADMLNKLEVEDLTRRNEERDVNTGRLQNFYGQQVNQGTSKQQMDQNAWATYNSQQMENALNDTNLYNQRSSNILGTIGGGAGLLAGGMGGGGGLASLLGGMRMPGTGIGQYDRNMSSSGGGVRSGVIGNRRTSY